MNDVHVLIFTKKILNKFRVIKILFNLKANARYYVICRDGDFLW